MPSGVGRGGTGGGTGAFHPLVRGVRHRTPAPASGPLQQVGRSGPQAFPPSWALLGSSPVPPQPRQRSGGHSAVRHWPTGNSDCRTLFYDSFLKSSFASSALYPFFSVVTSVWLDVTLCANFHPALSKRGCRHGEVRHICRLSHSHVFTQSHGFPLAVRILLRP